MLPPPNPRDPRSPSRTARCGNLSFTLGAEEYAIDILEVKEIRGYGAVTPIGGAPDFIKG